jgi:hypothetical protein
MQAARLLGGAFVVLAFGACASSPAFVPLLTPEENMVALAGEWRGEYTNAVTGRKSTLFFSLTPGEREAAGEIVVYPQGAPGVVNWERQVTLASARYLAEPLAVQFVSFESGILTARVGPYVDGNCGNVHVTTFFGELRNGRLVGSFVTRSEAHESQSGQWSASRVH